MKNQTLTLKQIEKIRENKAIREERMEGMSLPELPDEIAGLPSGHYGLYKLLTDFDFDTVLDIGSGSGEHALVFKNYGKQVTALDFGTSLYAQERKDKESNINRVEVDFAKYTPENKFDCLWAAHVLEHQPNPGDFIKKCIELTNENGVIAITVPPLKHNIVGGHLTLWNAGLLLYQLVFNGLDCSEASVCTYGYNVTVITRKKLRPEVSLVYDKGDIRALQKYFPSFVAEPFDGRILHWNW